MRDGRRARPSRRLGTHYVIRRVKKLPPGGGVSGEKHYVLRAAGTLRGLAGDKGRPQPGVQKLRYTAEAAGREGAGESQ